MSTTADYLNKLSQERDSLANNLTTMGVTADTTEALDTLVPKVLTIPTSGGGGGIEPSILITWITYYTDFIAGVSTFNFLDYVDSIDDIYSLEYATSPAKSASSLVCGTYCKGFMDYGSLANITPPEGQLASDWIWRICSNPSRNTSESVQASESKNIRYLMGFNTTTGQVRGVVRYDTATNEISEAGFRHAWNYDMYNSHIYMVYKAK